VPTESNLSKLAPHRRRRRALILALLFIAGLVALFAFFLGPRQTLPDFLVSRSQGYEHFLAAAEEIAGNPTYVTNGFANYVAMNKRAYDAIDRTIGEQIEPPARVYEPGAINVMELVGLRRIGQAMLLRSKAAEEQDQLRDALINAFEAIRFGQNVERGPLINLMVGSNVELSAIKRIEDLLPKLTLTNLAATTSTLRQLNRARLPFSEIRRREDYFSSQNATNMIQAIRERFSSHSRNTFKDAEERYFTTAAKLEILATTIAAKHYELTRNRKPTSLADLTPAFLPSLPIDPFSKKPLRLIQTNAQLVIYSIGPNKRDDSANSDDITLSRSDAIGFRMLINSLNQQ
jgi:hypothetical protein